LVQSGLVFKNLPAHRRAVKNAMELVRVLWPQRHALNAVLLAPPIAPAPGPAGAGLMGAAGFTMTGPRVYAHWEGGAKKQREAPGINPRPPPNPVLPFNWRHITASFAFGFLVAALVGFQFQEWRRRAKANAN